MNEYTPSELSQTASRTEEASVLTQMLRSSHRDQHSLFLPRTEFYDKLESDEGATQVALEICRWIGIKPHKLKVVFTDKPESSSEHVIVLRTELQKLPYHAGAELAIACIKLIIHQKYPNTELNRSALEHATVIVGLAPLILNAINYKESFAEKWHRIVIKKHLALPLVLTSYSRKSYVDAAIAHCRINEIDIAQIMSYIPKAIIPQPPNTFTTVSEKHDRIPRITAAQRSHALSVLIKFSLLSLLTGALFVVGTVLWHHKPTTTSEEAQESYAKLRQLENDYNACTQQARAQINSYPGDDIFTERHIDSILGLCQSIKNEYNYELSEYKMLIDK